MQLFQNASILLNSSQSRHSMLLNSSQSCRSFDRIVMFDHKNPGPAIRTIRSLQGSNLFTFMSGIFTECCGSCLGLLSPGTQTYKL